MCCPDNQASGASSARGAPGRRELPQADSLAVQLAGGVRAESELHSPEDTCKGLGGAKGTINGACDPGPREPV